MKILYALNSGDPGGMEKHVYDLVVGMVAEGHEVFVWCPDGEIVSWFKEVGSQVIFKSITSDFDAQYIYELYSFLKKYKIDVLHAHELKAVCNAGVASYFAKTKVRIAHVHTPISEWKISSIRKTINILVYTTVVNWFYNKEIALTESRKQVKISEGIKPEKIEIIPNGVDVQKFDISQVDISQYKQQVRKQFSLPVDAFIFGYIGRMTKEKGHETLIKAFGEFCKMKNTSSVYLLLAGGGQLESKMLQLLTDLNLTGRVFITGVYPQQDFEKYLFSLDAFIMPSLAEGFGIVLIEAMAAGLPIICSDLPVLQEVGGSTVFYFESGNSADLSLKMLNLYKRMERFDELGSDAKKRVKELFTLDTFVNKYKILYSTLLTA